jgi:phosphatidylglycerophosphate synthase
MLDHRLRGVKDYTLAMVARRLERIHPNTITVMSLVVGILAALLLIQQQYTWALCFWLFNRLLDGLDGLVARIHQRQSDLGGYLDILIDFAIYALIPIALIHPDPTVARCFALAFLLGSFYLNAVSWLYLAALLEKRATGAQARGELTSVTMPAGLIGGTETVIFYCLFIIFHQYAAWLFVAMGVLVLFTVGQRLVWAVHHLD